MTVRRVVADRYRLGKRLGGGGFGEVFEARHEVTGQRCAVKLLVRGVAEGRSYERLTRESQLGARVTDEHAVAILDAGVDDGTPFLVMELLEGEDLGRRLARIGKFTSAEVVTFLTHAARGLATAHRQDIVHRDLKPSNLFLTVRPKSRPWVKILDFGTARLCAGDSLDASTLAAGTPLYMAPELFETKPVSPAVDIYALGMCAFEMLVGTHYYALEKRQSGNPFALGALLVKGPPESASARAARYGQTVPEGFDAWFARCTDRDAGGRPALANDAIVDLQVCLKVTEEALEAVTVETSTADVDHDAEPDETRTLRPTSAMMHRHSAPPSPAVEAPKRFRGTRVAVTMGAGAIALLGVLWLSNSAGERSRVTPARLMVGTTRFGYAAPTGEDRRTAVTAAPSSRSPRGSLSVAPKPSLPVAAPSSASSSAPRLWTRE